MKRSTGINFILIFLKTENIHRCNCRSDEDSFVILLTADGTILIELFLSQTQTPIYICGEAKPCTSFLFFYWVPYRPILHGFQFQV